jgi:hypothetical protein
MRTFRRLSLYAVALGLVALATVQATHGGLSPTQIGVTTKVLMAWLAVIVARYVSDRLPPPGALPAGFWYC